MVKIAAKSAARNKKGVIKTGGKVVQRNIPGLAQATGRKIVKKSSKQVGSRALNKALSASDGQLLRALRSPVVQKAIINKIGREGAEKIGIKLAAGGAKGGIPLFGTAYGVVEGLVRLALGDPAGMMLSFGSAIPAAGWGFAIIDILRDIDKNAYIEHIKPNLPVPSNENLAGYFQQAFGLTPDQYERGNIDIKSSMIGDNTSAISEILGVTQAFGDATGFGGEAARIISDSGLGAYSVPKVNYGFDIGGFSTSKNIESIQGSEEEKELRMVRKKKKEDDDDDEKKKEEEKKEEKVDPTGGDPTDFRNIGKNIKNWWNNMRGGGGIGGDDNVQATTPIMGGNGATIEFWGEQGRDLSGEPGVDFSYKDYKSNYSLFPGYILETGLLYGSRYGNVVVVRSVDPSNGLEFDSLYAHFPNGGIAVKPGQVVSAGEYLGAVGFIGKRGPNGEARMQGNGAGNMSGYHTSVDFYEPGSYDKYRNLSVIQSLITGAEGQTPVGLLEKLKPPTKSNDQSSLNNVESNNRLATTMTNMVENGSSERLMTKRKASKRPPIVIINNQIVNTSQTQIAMGNNNKESGNFFEAYNLARYTV